MMIIGKINRKNSIKFFIKLKRFNRPSITKKKAPNNNPLMSNPLCVLNPILHENYDKKGKN
jgi:hypothetical protein